MQNTATSRWETTNSYSAGLGHGGFPAHSITATAGIGYALPARGAAVRRTWHGRQSARPLLSSNLPPRESGTR